MNPMNPSSGQSPYQVVCICGGYGFPLGTASAARITMVGKALQTAGVAFRLLHCGPSPVAVNTERSGVYEGIAFEYTTSVKRPQNNVARLFVYLRGVMGLIGRLTRLWPARFQTLVYLYVMDGPLNLYARYLCRLLGLPVVQELCEWLPGEPTSSALTKWLHRGSMFKKAVGVLVISNVIEERVRERASKMNLDLLVHRVPAMVDMRRFSPASPGAPHPGNALPQFLYCGTWPRDMRFVIGAFAHVRRRGFACQLKIVGNSAGDCAELLAYAHENGLSPEDLVLAGCLVGAPLAEAYRTAVALLAPLFQDDRSITRLPNKLGEYLACGRPVISSNIGDLTFQLADGVSAYLAEPGDARDFARKMIAVLQDPARADKIGARGWEVCATHFDYRAHVNGLANFFRACIEHRRRLETARKTIGRFSQGKMLLRNCFCGLIALAVIGSGGVRRGRRRALRGDVVTAIYFHKPNRKLLDRCLEWLIKHGYTFISAHDLVAILDGVKRPPRGAVWLSFDDGCKELLEDVLPLVRRYHTPVTLFIPSGIVEGDGRFPWLWGKSTAPLPSANATYRDSITLADLKRVALYPEVTIGCHTDSHAVTINFTPEQARFEFGESRRKLTSWTGRAVECFAYPEGRFDGRAGAFLARFGFRLAATTQTALITPETNRYLVPRFCVPDNVSFPEAICNMAGVWRPVIDPVIQFLEKCAVRRRERAFDAAGAPAESFADESMIEPDITEPAEPQFGLASRTHHSRRSRGNA